VGFEVWSLEFGIWIVRLASGAQGLELRASS